MKLISFIISLPTSILLFLIGAIENLLHYYKYGKAITSTEEIYENDDFNRLFKVISIMERFYIFDLIDLLIWANIIIKFI